MIKSLQKKQLERDMQTNMKDDARKEPRIFLTLKHQDDYRKMELAKIRDASKRDQQPKLASIDGFKKPDKIDLSKGFINDRRDDPSQSKDMIDKLNFRKK